MLLRLITFRQQFIKSILSRFLKLEIVYNGKPYYSGSLDPIIDPTELKSGDLVYNGKPYLIDVKE